MGGGTPVDGQLNTYMIKTSEQVWLTMQPNYRYSDGFLGRSFELFGLEEARDNAVIFRMDIPYLYFNQKGSVETIDKDEWERNQLEGMKFKNDHQRLAYFPNSDALNRYDFSQDKERWYTTEEMTDPENGPLAAGLSGTWYFRYKSTSSEHQYELGPAAQTMEGQVRFVGTVPDNTGATALLGYEYINYTDGDGVEKTGMKPTEVEPGRKRAEGAKNVLRATFIQTNLQWNLNVSSRNTPVLWDHYNYAVYTVQTENVSDTRDSEIDFLNYVLMFPNATGSTSGVRAEDLLTWKSKDGGKTFHQNGGKGDPINAAETNAVYIGKPKEGGALVYDVSKLSEADIKAIVQGINADDFGYQDEYGITPLSYTTGGKDGQITVDIREEDMPYGKHLFSHTAKANQSVSPDFVPDEDESDVHTLLVAMPYTTNYGDGAGGYAKAWLRSYSTVNFGNRGYDPVSGNSNDYQWMQEKLVNSSFTKPEFDVTVDKKAWSTVTASKPVPTLSDSQSAPLGEMVSYHIAGMENKSNLPLFGSSSDTSYGAVLADQLPSGFQLTGITLKVNASGESDTIVDVPAQPGKPAEGDTPAVDPVEEVTHQSAALKDWFDMTGTVVEFEVRDATGKSQWMGLSVPVEIERAADDSSATYRLGSVEHAADGIAELLEAKGVAAVPGRRYSGAKPSLTFTGAFRILLKKVIPTKAAIPVSVDVTGLMMERQSNGKNNYYDNKAEIAYGKKLWDSGTNKYTVTPTTKPSPTATFRPKDPQPQAVAKVFSKFDGSGVSDPNMTTEADKRNALVNTADAGFRFRFGDTSESRMAPSVISVGPVPDGMKRITGSGGQLVPDPATPKKPQFTTNAIKLGPGFSATTRWRRFIPWCCRTTTPRPRAT